MQIIGSFKIVTGVTSVVPTFWAALRFFDLFLLLGFTVTFALFVKMRRGVSLLRERRGRCPSTLQAFEKA